MKRNSAAVFLLTMKPGGGFTPASISGLSLWLDASDATTLFQDSDGTTPATANNDPVGYWGDKSGNGKNATQATAGLKPRLKTALINGLNAVNLDGGDTLVTPAIALTTFTVLTVFRATDGYILYEHSIDAGANDGSLLIVRSNTTIIARRGANRSDKNIASLWGHDNTWRIATHTMDGTHAGHTLYLNGSIPGGLVDGANTANPGSGSASAVLYIGSRVGATAWVTGDLAELLVVSPVLSTDDREMMEAYLNAKWAVF